MLNATALLAVLMALQAGLTAALIVLVQRRHRRVVGDLKRRQQRLSAELRQTRRMIWDSVNLVAALQPQVPLPPPGAWAVSADLLAELVRRILLERPGLVVELGSGLSTVVIALALRRTGGRLVAVDHDEAFAAETRATLEAHGLTEIAQVRVAPLVGGPSAASAPWYREDALADLAAIDLLIVDGPPAPVAAEVRYPALPFFWPRLKPGAAVVLDDADRPGEQAVIRRWQAEFAGAEVARLDLEKGAVVLRKPARSG